MFILKVIRALEKAKVKYAIVGGYAVALHGAVRGTVDLDIVVTISPSVFKRAEQALNSLGLHSRLPVTPEELFQFREEYISRRNLVAWSFVNSNNPMEMVDIIITHDLAHLKTKRLTVSGQSLVVLDRTSLIKMKEESGRPQDLADVEALRKL